MSFLFIIVGFLLLIKSADILIDSGVSLAKIFSVPASVIGFTVIAFGTSAPELVIGIFSGLRQANMITLGDIIGSNIANVALIIGITAFIKPVPIDGGILFREIPIYFGVQALFILLLLMGGVLSRSDAILLLLFFCGYLVYLYLQTTNLEEYIDEYAEEKVEKRTEKLRISKVLGWLTVSLIGTIAGGSLVVSGSTQIAELFGLSDALIGTTIVAIGTSLPELTTSLTASYKGEQAISIGNIMGSNVFNILLVLGVSSYIHPIPYSSELTADLFVLVFSAVALFLLAFSRRQVSRKGGALLFGFYLVYIFYKVFTVI